MAESQKHPGKPLSLPCVTLLLGLLHAAAGLSILVISAWFIAACAIATVNFNYMLPAVVIRALALLRIGAGYAHMWAGHHDLLNRTASIRSRLFHRLADSRINSSAPLADALSNHTETLASVWIASVSPLLNALILLPVLMVCGIWLALPGTAAVLILAAGWLILTAYLIWRSLILASALAVTEQRWLADSAGYFKSAPVWHLYSSKAHQQVSMKAVRDLHTALSALADYGVWILQGLAFLLAGVVVIQTTDTGLGNPLAICIPMVLMAVPDWLGKTLPAATFYARFDQARHAMRSLHITAVLPVSATTDEVCLSGFRASGRPMPEVSASLAATGIIAVTGPSGVGKSSLLQALAGELSWQGSKTVNAQAIESGLLSNWYYVDQQASLLQATLKDNLSPSGKDMDAVYVSRLLHRLGLGYLNKPDEWLGAGGRELSGGERKRIALARALLHQPHTLLLDEPFEGLDRFSVKAVVALLNEYAQDHRVVVSTHILPDTLRYTQTLRLAFPLSAFEPSPMKQAD